MAVSESPMTATRAMVSFVVARMLSSVPNMSGSATPHRRQSPGRYGLPTPTARRCRTSRFGQHEREEHVLLGVDVEVGVGLEMGQSGVEGPVAGATVGRALVAGRDP